MKRSADVVVKQFVMNMEKSFTRRSEEWVVVQDGIMRKVMRKKITAEEDLHLVVVNRPGVDHPVAVDNLQVVVDHLVVHLVVVVHPAAVRILQADADHLVLLVVDHLLVAEADLLKEVLLPWTHVNKEEFLLWVEEHHMEEEEEEIVEMEVDSAKRKKLVNYQLFLFFKNTNIHPIIKTI
jgi:hypothetical protein